MWSEVKIAVAKVRSCSNFTKIRECDILNESLWCPFCDRLYLFCSNQFYLIYAMW